MRIIIILNTICKILKKTRKRRENERKYKEYRERITKRRQELGNNSRVCKYATSKIVFYLLLLNIINYLGS